jgi:sigma-E factor negative regulatory protein RseA
MSDAKREGYSALLDGEVDDVEQQALLAAIGDDEHIRPSLARYRLIGDGLRGEPVRIDALGVADAVRERLQREPVVLAPPPAGASRHARPRWWQPAAGLAIAASVALVAVGLVPRMLSDSAETPASVQVVGVPVAPPMLVSDSDPRPAAGTHWIHSAPAEDDRLTRYLADHTEMATQTGMPGIVPYASFVGYDGQR